MFTKEYEFRYGDLAKDSTIKIGSLLDIMQDAATKHSASVGYDNVRLHEMSVAWLLEGWRLKILSAIDDSAPVTVKTGIMSVKSCESLRCYELWQSGVLKVKATADWFTVNTEKMRITRIPKEIIECYESVNEADNGLPFERFKPEADIKIIDTRKIENRDLDTNYHLNNVKSVEIMLDYLPCDFRPEEIRVRYRKELKAGEEVSICRKYIENGICIEMKNAEGDACVMMQVY